MARQAIRKAVIPAAGIGSRLLPLTKATPKEMLPVGDKPVIEHTVRELVNSGITDITIVVSGGKSLIEEHFRPNTTLVDQLRADGKDAYADAVEEVGELSARGHITYLHQHGPYGNGTPVLNASRSFGDEPVLVLWPDDVFVAQVPRAQQLIRAYEQAASPVLALMPMPPEQSRRYGVPIIKEDLGQGLLRISGIVEKPQPDEAPSDYAAIGGYVITPGVIDELREQTNRWHEGTQTGEIYLTDAINAYAKDHAAYGQVIQGHWYDTGNPSDYLVAQFAFALAHPEYGPVLRDLASHVDGPLLRALAHEIDGPRQAPA
ncbi:UTP--glucose-1-phosphate uridylyltransferase [Mycolicibacterium sp. HK-90]|uniref:UTP--glucose-1-phosphate uridylyltransferase n=1 Tax=Mycolicibacterium sp. HK-90 TaxID=3056937 RepID=UPI00265A9F3D|nr:UTP--glucose-1-phosphate uridylyltransferase [Mycolicibacterium sp. HK-90]WKG03146.1 UTP--glucose-1-phosphate uridylyltransferase [Mycolicibacterium sp. HK-90]